MRFFSILAVAPLLVASAAFASHVTRTETLRAAQRDGRKGPAAAVRTIAVVAEPPSTPPAAAGTSGGARKTITKRDGTVLEGVILRELEQGYLFRTQTGTQVVLFSDVVQIRDESAAAPAAQLSVAAADAQCVPECRAGFTCKSGRCVSLCNPPCASLEVCVDGARCVSRRQERARLEDERDEEHLTEIARESAGLHWGVAAGAENGLDLDGKQFAFTLRAEGVANWRLGSVDLRASAGLQLPLALTLNGEALFLMGSRYAFGLGLRFGTSGHASGSETRRRELSGSPTLAVHVSPAVFRLGSRRNLLLAVTMSYSTSRFLASGLELTYLFY